MSNCASLQARTSMHTPETSMTRRWLVASLIVVAAWLSSAKAQQATSDQPTYDVEILIFQHLSTDATEELWNLELQAHKGLDIPADDVSPFDASIPAVHDPVMPSLLFRQRECSSARYKLHCDEAATTDRLLISGG